MKSKLLLLFFTFLSFIGYSQQQDTIVYAQGPKTVTGALPAYNVKDNLFYSYIDFIGPGYVKFDKPTYLTKVYSTTSGVIKVTLEDNVRITLLATGNQDFIFMDYSMVCDFEYIKKLRVISIETNQQTGIVYLRKK